MSRIDKKSLYQLAALAWPMIISQGADMAMIFTDRLFLAKVSSIQMAAAMGGGITSFLCNSFFIGILSYLNPLTAQYLGAKKRSNCSKALSAGVCVALLSYPILMFLALGVKELFTVFHDVPALVANEKLYFQTLIYGAIFFLLKITFASYFCGIGRTRVVMIANIFCLLINIPLSYILIFGKFGLAPYGILGAAIGTIISAFLTCIFLLVCYLGKRNFNEFKVNSSWVIKREILGRLLKFGVPSGTEFFLNIAAFNLFLLIFQSYGVNEAASIAIVLNWDMVSFIPLIGLNIAVTSMVGRSFGAQDIPNLKKVITSGFLMGIGFSLVMATIFIAFRYSLVEVFSSSDTDFIPIKNLAAAMMVPMASYVVFDGIILVASGVLRGVGDTRWLMRTSIILHWLMLGGEYMLIKVLKVQPEISWIGFVVFILVTGAIYVARLRHQSTISFCSNL